MNGSVIALPDRLPAQLGSKAGTLASAVSGLVPLFRRHDGNLEKVTCS